MENFNIEASEKDLDQILTGLDDLPEIVDESNAPGVAEPELDEAAVRELELHDAKAEAYAEQESVESTDLNTEIAAPSVTPVTTAEVAAVEEKKAKRKRVSSAGKKKSEVIASHLGANSAEYFVLETADADLKPDELKDREKEVLASIDALAKKVSEKAVNLMNFVKTGEHLSVYTTIALDLLTEKGTVTSENLRQKMRDEGYTVGTSNSQSQQMFQLFPALKIATRVKNILTLNDESTIVAKYLATKAAASAAPAAEKLAA